MQKLFLDLDGLGADWGSWVVKRFDGVTTIEELNGLPFEERQQRLKAFYEKYPRTFYSLPKIRKYQQLLDYAKTYFNEWYILTAGSDAHPSHDQVVSDKQHWVADMFEVPKNKCIVVKESKDKIVYAKGNILVDDFKRNCMIWTAAGGKAILAPTTIYDPKLVIAVINKILMEG